MRKVDKLTSCVDRYIRGLIKYCYQLPVCLFRFLINPGSIFRENYFPEKKEKSRGFIFFSQLKNVINYGSLDEFFYMYGLNVKPYKSQKNYVHYTEFMTQRDKLNLSNPHNTSCILRDKQFFYCVCRGFGLPTPAIEAIFLSTKKSVYLYETNREITLYEFIKSYNGKLFCKPINGECGSGAFLLEVVNNRILVNEIPITQEELEDKISRTDYILQHLIEQHPLMSKLYDKSINSLRIVTVRNKESGEIEVLPSILRIGANGSTVDNTSQGGLWVEVDNVTGKLGDRAYYKPEFGLTTLFHPNSKIEFSKFTVPYMNEAVQKCIFFHSLLDLHSIGWDVAICENGPLFIEGNDNWEINGHQNYNNGLKSTFKRLFC